MSIARRCQQRQSGRGCLELYFHFLHMTLRRAQGKFYFCPAAVSFGHGNNFIAYVFKFSVMELDMVRVKQQIIQNFEREILPYQITNKIKT